MSSVTLPASAQFASSRLSAKEQQTRAQSVSLSACSTPDCVADVHVGMFFDGTNNNKKRDQEDVSDPNARSHSNVVVLFDTYNDKLPNHFRFYVPGVGTPFPDIGETGESSDGKAMALGGEARIHWAMIQVLNAIHFAAYEAIPIDKKRTEQLINGIAYLGTWPERLPAGDARRRGTFGSLILELAINLKKKLKPRLPTLHLTVFGFSRGAAEARTFCTWLDELWRTVVEPNDLIYGSVPRLRIQFVGLFDTVASVGLANSAPIPNDGGLMGWADGTLELPARVEQCVHYTAMHEIRKSFPLSTGRKSACTVREVMYPGAHSDVGGGYAPGEQGKGRTRLELLSQVPLLHMYREARTAGVPLGSEKELRQIGRGQVVDELKMDSALAKRFDEYRNHGPQAGEIKRSMREHLRWYWRWRLQVGPQLDQLASVKAANAQDRADLLASEQDFRRDIIQAQKDNASIAYRKAHPIVTAVGDAGVASTGAAPNVPVLTEAECIVLTEQARPQRIPPLISEFFDLHVHDSHASFYLVGPTSALERQKLIADVVAKQKRGEALNGYERRVAAHQKTRPGQLPTMTDADTADLLSREGAMTRITVRMMTATRRESEGHVRERVIFDKS